MFGEPVAQLTHVQHGYLFPLGSTVHPEGEITQFSIGHTDKRMTGGADMGGLGHFHGEVFQLRKARILPALRFEDIFAPKAYDGELGRFVLPAPVDIQRHFGLDTRHRGTGSYDLAGQF